MMKQAQPELQKLEKKYANKNTMNNPIIIPRTAAINMFITLFGFIGFFGKVALSITRISFDLSIFFSVPSAIKI